MRGERSAYLIKAITQAVTRYQKRISITRHGAMWKAVPVVLSVFIAMIAVAQSSSPPPDVTASQAYPEDLVKGLSDDSAAQKCWNDEVDGSNYDWNKSGNPAIVKYTYKFRNTCNRPIACTLVIASGTVLRDKAARHGSWRPYKADRKSFTIKPGEVVTIAGTLEWTATETRMPSMNDDNMPCRFTN